MEVSELYCRVKDLLPGTTYSYAITQEMKEIESPYRLTLPMVGAILPNPFRSQHFRTFRLRFRLQRFHCNAQI